MWFVIDCLARFQLTTGGAGVLEVENLTDLVSMPAGFQLSAAEEDLFDTDELEDPLAYIKEFPHEAHTHTLSPSRSVRHSLCVLTHFLLGFGRVMGSWMRDGSRPSRGT